MHMPPIFRNEDPREALAFIEAHPFATLAVNGDEGPVTALVPLVMDETGETLLGHVARINPFWKAAQADGKAVAVFKGADAYISPSSYPSKAEHGRAVPTWNYIAVEMRGTLVVETDADAMQPYLTALTDKMESHRELPWQVSDAPDGYISKLSRAIVGFQLNVNDITYVKKLSQNKSPGDKAGVVQSLESSGKNLERLVALEMKVKD